MQIRRLKRNELDDALPLVWKVFCEYEAADHSESGKQAFWDAVHSKDYLDMLTAFGAFERGGLVGVIATRNGGKHVALFFVDGEYQHRGIGRALWNAVLEDSTAKEITVHSSLFARDIYQKLGFETTDDRKEEDGIQYYPMVYRRETGD